MCYLDRTFAENKLTIKLFFIFFFSFGSSSLFLLCLKMLYSSFFYFFLFSFKLLTITATTHAVYLPLIHIEVIIKSLSLSACLLYLSKMVPAKRQMVFMWRKHMCGKGLFVFCPSCPESSLLPKT